MAKHEHSSSALRRSDSSWEIQYMKVVPPDLAGLGGVGIQEILSHVFNKLVHFLIATKPRQWRSITTRMVSSELEYSFKCPPKALLLSHCCYRQSAVQADSAGDLERYSVLLDLQVRECRSASYDLVLKNHTYVVWWITFGSGGSISVHWNWRSK